jgi:hypothetical protein
VAAAAFLGAQEVQEVQEVWSLVPEASVLRLRRLSQG